MLPPLENMYVEAQRRLATAVRNEYISLQKAVLEMENAGD